MAGLETINDVVGQKVWTELEERLPNALDGAAKKMADTAAFFKANPISFGGTGNIKSDIESINKLKVAQEGLHSVNEKLSKQDIIAARIAKERAIKQKNLAQARLADAKATDIQEKAQQRKINADLKEAAAIENKRAAQNTPITHQDSYSGNSDSLSTSDAQAGLNASQAEAQAEASLAAAASIKEKTKAEASDTIAVVENLSVTQQLSETLTVAKLELDAVNSALKQNTASYRSGAISEAEYVATGRNLIKQQSELKSIVSTTSSELTKQTKANLAAAGSMEKLSVDLEILKAEYKALNAEQRASPFGLALQENIKKADANIKTLSATIGENQRNVGNYTGGITKAFSGAFGFLRQIAYIVPGLGMAGIFNLAFEAIEKVVAGFKDVSEEAKKYQEQLENVSTTSNENAQKEINKLTILSKVAQDENKTRKQRLDAVAQLQKVFPAYFKDLSQETILYGDITNAVKLSTQSILANAKAKAYAGQADVAADRFVKEKEALDKATKASADYYGKNEKLIEQQRKNADIVATQGANARSSGIAQTGALTKFLSLEKQRQDALDKTIESQKDIIKYQNLAAGNANDVVDLVGGTESKTPIDHSAQIQSRQEDKDRTARLAAEKELADAIRDNRAALAEETIQINKRIFEDESKTLDVRMGAYAKYFDARNKQVELNGKKELADIIVLESEIKKVEAEPEAQRSDADNALLLRKKGIAERRKGIEVKLQADLAEIQTQASADQLKILESASNEAIKFLESRISTLKELSSDILLFDEQKLLDRLKKGKISLVQYEKDKKIIEDNSALDSLKTERDLLQKELDTNVLSNDAKISLEKKLHDVKVKLNQAELKLEEDKIKLQKSLNRQAVSDAISSAQEIIGAIQQGLNYRYEQQQKNFDAQSKGVEDNLQKELDAIATSGKSKKQQEEEVEAAKGRAETAQKQIDEDRRKAQIAAAQRNKAIAISEIILNTAKAVSSALPNIPLALAAGIAGATQLAIAVATPIPQYAEGIEFHPGGKAIVGDGGERELINDGGRKYWSPSVPTVVDLGRGASVTPESDLMQMAHVDAMRALKGVVSPETYAMEYVNSFERLTGEMGKVNSNIGHLTMVVKNKKEFKVNITPNGLRWGAKEHNARTEYLNRRIHIG